MSLKPSPGPGDASEEISALIQSLHRTERRLEVLTGGEVDTVADHEGRTLLLRRAQDHLRNSEAAKQAAYIEALRSSEARYRGLIEQATDGIFAADRNGSFLLVNARFCKMLGYEESELLGRSVLETYSEAERPAAIQRMARLDDHLPQVFERDMRRKDGTVFAVEMSVAQNQDGLRQGIVRDITVRRRARKIRELEHSIATAIADAEGIEAGLRSAIQSVCRTEEWECGRYFALDEAQGVLRFAVGWCASDPALEKFLAESAGQVCRRGVGLVGNAWQSGGAIWIPDISHDSRARRGSDTLALGVHGAFLFPATLEGKTIGIFAFDSREVREPDKRLLQAVGVIGAQIGQFLARKQEQLRMARLSRIHEVLSGINAAIIRLRTRNALFLEACRIAVESGGFRLAWVGVVDARSQAVVPAAWHGAGHDYIGLLPLALSEESSLAVRAIARREVMVVNEMSESPHPALRKEALTRGFKSMIVLPLLVGGKAAGVLVLHSGESGYFNDDEVKLLRDMAENIAFAIDTLDTQEQLLTSEARFRQMAENISDLFFLREVDSGRVLYASPAYEKIWGRSCESLYADAASWSDAIHPDDRASTLEQSRTGLLAGKLELEYRIVRPGGAIRWIKSKGFPVRDDGGRLVRMAGVAEDITERKQGVDALHRLSAAVDVTEDAFFLVDRATMAYIYVNDAACRMVGHTREQMHLLGPSGVRAVSLSELESTYDRLIASGGDTKPLEVPSSGKDGTTSWHEVRRYALHSADRWMIVTIVRDITQRKQAEHRIAHLNRVYAVLSGINTLIVRVRERDELFREACRIAVEDGGFRMSLIAATDPGTTTITPVASFGKDEALLAGIKGLLASAEAAPSTMAAQAIREMRPIVCNDSSNDPRVVFGKAYADSGVRSMAVLPLIVSDKAVGVLALYAGESDFFQADEMKLLVELAGDIAFAIDHIEKQERLDYLAYYDALTGLANRRLFLERVAQYVRIALAEGHSLAVFLIDLERFKSINDTLGQSAGDSLLKQVAQWLTERGGDSGLLARVDADHFAVVVPQVKQQGNMAHLVERALQAFLEHPFHLGATALRIAAKVGGAVYPEDGADANALFRNAEAALKKAKASGERYLFYTPRMTEAVAGSLSLENQLRRALDNDEFVLHYQPKLSLATGKLTGAEALIRWNDPSSGLVPPGRFIPVLEEIGLINDVGRWALRKALEDYLGWRSAGRPAVRISVNVSPLQLRKRSFAAEILEVIGGSLGAAAGLELEITESLIMEDVNHSINTLRTIRNMGVRVSIDDFGTGFSSLSYLARLPVDTLKIDRSFVTDMTASSQGLSLVSTIINLAHSLKLTVVAEGVETEEQSRLLSLLSCDETQGFLFSKPLPADVFEAAYLTLPAAA